MNTEVDWYMSYRHALASLFAMGEVIGRIRDETGLSVDYVDSLINESTAKWHDKVDEEREGRA